MPFIFKYFPSDWNLSKKVGGSNRNFPACQMGSGRWMGLVDHLHAMHFNRHCNTCCYIIFKEICYYYSPLYRWKKDIKRSFLAKIIRYIKLNGEPSRFMTSVLICPQYAMVFEGKSSFFQISCIGPAKDSAM